MALYSWRSRNYLKDQRRARLRNETNGAAPARSRNLSLKLALVTTNFRGKFLEWARDAARPLVGIDPSLPMTDLESLATLINGARIVGIGESWHGSRELLSLKHRFVRFLVERAGFNALVYEGSLSGSDAINACVMGGEGDLPELVRRFGQPMWLNHETVDLLIWLRSHNEGRAAEDKVQIFGMDCVYPSEAITSTLDYVGRIDGRHPLPGRRTLERIAKRFADVPLDSKSRSAVWGATEVYNALSQSDRERLSLTFIGAIARMAQLRSTYAGRSSSDEFEWMMRQAIVVLQACEVLGSRARSVANSTKARDLAFAENVHWIVDKRMPRARAIVIAHNLHIAKEPFRVQSAGGWITSLGGYLAQWFDQAYVAIGTAVGTREVNGEAGLAGNNDPRTTNQKSRRETFDALLEEVGLPAFFLDIQLRGDTSPRSQWLLTPQRMRAHVSPTPEYAPAKAFDALMYVDRIGPASDIAGVRG